MRKQRLRIKGKKGRPAGLSEHFQCCCFHRGIPILRILKQIFYTYGLSIYIFSMVLKWTLPTESRILFVSTFYIYIIPIKWQITDESQCIYIYSECIYRLSSHLIEATWQMTNEVEKFEAFRKNRGFIIKAGRLKWDHCQLCSRFGHADMRLIQYHVYSSIFSEVVCMLLLLWELWLSLNRYVCFDRGRCIYHQCVDTTGNMNGHFKYV